MTEKYIRPRSGAKAVAIDNRAQIAKLRLLLLSWLLLATGLATVLGILLAR